MSRAAHLVLQLRALPGRLVLLRSGAAAQHPWIGFLVAVILIGVHLTLSLERSLETRLIVVTTVIGLVMETAQIMAGTYRFPSGTVNEAFPAPWL